MFHISELVKAQECNFHFHSHFIFMEDSLLYMTMESDSNWVSGASASLLFTLSTTALVPNPNEKPLTCLRLMVPSAYQYHSLDFAQKKTRSFISLYQSV